MDPVLNEPLLDERLAALEAARSWSPRVISKLESQIRGADDAALHRINPLRFAAEKGMAEAEAIDLFLHATALGLFEMNWQLLCPICSCIVESFRSLKGVHECYHCAICQADYVASLDDFIAVSFAVSPMVRELRYHHPDSLSAEDYCFTYRMAPEGQFPGGLPFAEALKSVTPALGYLPPGETTRFEVDVGAGTLFGYDLDSEAQMHVAVAGAPAEAPQHLAVTYRQDGCDPSASEVHPGHIVIDVTNATDRRGLFGIALLPPDMPKPDLQFAPFLSGKRLLTTQTFRDLFRYEVIHATEGLGVKEIALLFTDLKGSTALYDRIGDLNAFALVRQHFERLRDVTVQHGGAIIKTIGDAVMAAFLDPRDAVAAAVAMLREIGAFNRGQPHRELILKIGVHRGAAIAVTLNERLDYFGQTVNIAARVQALADAEEIYLTSEVYESPGVADLLAPFSVEPRRAQLKGVNQEMPVYRVLTGGVPADTMAGAA